MIKFIYFGRVTYEKGIDNIIECFSSLIDKKVTNRHLDIYGDGPLLPLCQIRAKKNPHNITVHGWASHQVIQQSLRGMHYSIMPSRVMESFGMSALESLAAGVPVIGAKHGGLQQLIDDKLDITKHGLLYVVEQSIKHFSSEDHRKEMKNAHDTASLFTREKWREKIQHIGDFTTVFLISDYIARVGGIESMLYNTKHVLENHGSQVYMYGWKLQKAKKMPILRKVGLISTAYNRRQYLTLAVGQKQHKPTILWLHSVNRYLGWLPISALKKNHTTQVRCSIHDMGMFHPFGAQVTSLDDIPDSTMSGFMSVTNNPFKKFLIALKYLNVLFVRKQLIKKVDVWFIPSPFLVDLLHKKRHIPLRKITVLPHFI